MPAEHTLEGATETSSWVSHTGKKDQDGWKQSLSALLMQQRAVWNKPHFWYWCQLNPRIRRVYH